MFQVELTEPVESVLAACQARGLRVRSERTMGGTAGGRHWHLGMAGRPGTLELSESRGRVWLKVHPLRDGGWASDFATELAESSTSRTDSQQAYSSN